MSVCYYVCVCASFRLPSITWWSTWWSSSTNNNKKNIDRHLLCKKMLSSSTHRQVQHHHCPKTTFVCEKKKICIRFLLLRFVIQWKLVMIFNFYFCFNLNYQIWHAMTWLIRENDDDDDDKNSRCFCFLFFWMVD